jgi:hypothetical protein
MLVLRFMAVSRNRSKTDPGTDSLQPRSFSPSLGRPFLARGLVGRRDPAPA